MRKKNDGRGRLGGRGKGTPNKVSGELRSVIACFVEGKITELNSWFEQMEAAKKADILLRLLPYVITPKQTDGRGESEEKEPLTVEIIDRREQVDETIL